MISLDDRVPFYPFHYKTIDYDGLYPPANLDLSEAIQNYSKYRVEQENWMLSRFIISSTKLEELKEYKNLFYTNPPFTFSVIGGKTNTTIEFKKNLDSVITAVNNFSVSIGKDLVRTECLELKVPVLEDILFVLNNITDSISKYTLETPLEIYLEFSLSQKHNQDLKLILSHLKDYNFNNRNPKIKFIGYKVRTGGIEAKDFPSIDKLASVILECNNYGVLLKATAGLHHPIRHYAQSVQTHMYGFINVIGASILTSIHKLDFDTIYEILSEEEPANFKFTDQKFIWRDYEATKEQIEFSRIKSFSSFGSCSFDEPLTDLESLGLLKRSEG